MRTFLIKRKRLVLFEEVIDVEAESADAAFERVEVQEVNPHKGKTLHQEFELVASFERPEPSEYVEF